MCFVDSARREDGHGALVSVSFLGFWGFVLLFNLRAERSLGFCFGVFPFSPLSSADFTLKLLHFSPRLLVKVRQVRGLEKNYTTRASQNFCSKTRGC